MQALNAALKCAVLVRNDQFVPHQRRQQGRRCRVDRGQGLIPKHKADHAGLLQRPSFGRVQPVQARLQHAGERWRDLGGEQFFRVDRPSVGADHNRALVDQHLDQFLHVEGVALGAADDHLAQG